MGRSYITAWRGRASELPATAARPGDLLEADNCVLRSYGKITPVPDLVEITPSGDLTSGDHIVSMSNQFDSSAGSDILCLAVADNAPSAPTTSGMFASQDLSTELVLPDPTSDTNSYDPWYDDNNRGNGSFSFQIMEPYTSRGNLYCCDSRGLAKHTDIGQDGEYIWEPRLYIEAGSAGAGTMLEDDKHVGYCVVAVFEDANGLIRRSRPSPMSVYKNETGSTVDVELFTRTCMYTFTHSSLRGLEVYRTRIFNITEALNQLEMFKILDVPATQMVQVLSYEYVTDQLVLIDSASDGELGETALLYTAFSGPNFAPPEALYHVHWKGHEIWLNGTAPALWNLRTKETIAEVIVSSTWTASDADVTVASAAGLELGMMIKPNGNMTVATGTYITTIAGTTVTLSAAPSDSGTSENLEFAPSALILYADGQKDRVPLHDRFDWDPYNDGLYTIDYFSDGTDYGNAKSEYTQELFIGSMHRAGRLTRGDAPAIWVNAPENWESPQGELGDLDQDSGDPAAASTAGLASTQETYVAGIWASKNGEPEHCTSLAPAAQIGEPSSPIVGAAVIGEMIIVFKKEGVYRITGSSPANWRLDPIDTTVRPIGGRTVKAVDDKAFCLAETGIIMTQGSSVTHLDDQFVGDWFEEDGATSGEGRLAWVLRHMRTYGFCPHQSVFAVADTRNREYALWCSGDPGNAGLGISDTALVYSSYLKGFTTWSQFATATRITAVSEVRGKYDEDVEQVPGVAFAARNDSAGASRVSIHDNRKDSEPHLDHTQTILVRSMNPGDATATTFWRTIAWNMETPRSAVNVSATFRSHDDGTEYTVAKTDAEAQKTEIRVWVPRQCRRSSELATGLTGEGLCVSALKVEYVNAGDAAPSETD